MRKACAGGADGDHTVVRNPVRAVLGIADRLADLV